MNERPPFRNCEQSPVESPRSRPSFCTFVCLIVFLLSSIVNTNIIVRAFKVSRQSSIESVSERSHVAQQQQQQDDSVVRKIKHNTVNIVYGLFLLLLISVRISRNVSIIHYSLRRSTHCRGAGRSGFAACHLVKEVFPAEHTR